MTAHTDRHQNKRRLTDRGQIAEAVDYMLGRGLTEQSIAMELPQMFYVDMDELNAVLTARATAPAAIARIEPGTLW